MGGTLLVVDGDGGMREALRRGLSRRGYRVRLAHDPASAVYCARREPPDLAIVDQNLTGELMDQSGLDLAAKLLGLRPSLRIVIFTGYPSLDAAFRAGREPGILGYLRKPAPIAGVLAALEGRPLHPATAHASLDQMQREYARRVLGDCGGNATRAAEALRITRSTLRRLLDH